MSPNQYMSGWGSHLPALAVCVAHTTGPVLELGVGAYSTPVLHALCANRMLVSIESDKAWLDLFSRFNAGMHSFVLSDSVTDALNFYWDVVLVDCAPGGKRVPFIQALRQHARLFVLHDTEEGPVCYHYDRVLPSFKYAVHSTWHPTRTTVVSDSDDLNWLRGRI